MTTSAEDLDQELIHLDRELCARPGGLRHFLEIAWPVLEPSAQFRPNWHIDAFCEHLEAVATFDLRLLVINVPPGTMKSLTCSVMFLAWVWGPHGHPERRSINTSYAMELATRDSVKTRRLLDSPWYRERWAVEMTSDQNVKTRFENDQTGMRLALSVGSGTGEHANFLFVDDPHNTEKVESDTERMHALDWWDHTLSTRGVEPEKTARVLIMQRQHPKDLTAHVLAEGEAEHLCLPMEYERTVQVAGAQVSSAIGWQDPRVTEGELLWPAMFPADVVAKLKKRLGSHATAGQLQQRPSPREGAIIKREWMKYYRELPRNERGAIPWAHRLHMWDMAFKKKEDSSFVVGQDWGRIGGAFYLVDQVREQIAFTGTIAMVKNFSGRHPEVMEKRVEPKANGPAIVDSLQKEIPGLMEDDDPEGSKDARLAAVSPLFEAGNVYLPDPAVPGNEWVYDYVEELCGATGYDDQRDCTAGALRRLWILPQGLQIYVGTAARRADTQLPQPLPAPVPAVPVPKIRWRAV